MKLPTEKECLSYFAQYQVPKNIFYHCSKVQEVAVFLAQKLKEQGLAINLNLVSCTALLHDLFKMAGIKDLNGQRFHQNHFSSDEQEMWKSLRKKYPLMKEHEVAYEVFKDAYPELALALLRSSSFRDKNKTEEEKLVHYADWRVCQDKVITLAERMNYLLRVYPSAAPFLEKDLKEMEEYERELFRKIKQNPVKAFEKWIKIIIKL